MHTWKASHIIWQSECFPQPEVRIFFSLLSQIKKTPSEQMSQIVVFPNLNFFHIGIYHVICVISLCYLFPISLYLLMSDMCSHETEQ